MRTKELLKFFHFFQIQIISFLLEQRSSNNDVDVMNDGGGEMCPLIIHCMIPLNRNESREEEDNQEEEENLITIQEMNTKFQQ